MTLTNPLIIPRPVANSDGTLTAAGQIQIDNSGFTGLLSSVTSTQAMAALVDGLMTNGGTPGMVSAEMVSVDDSGFTSVDADNAQEGFAELDRLFQIVSGSMPGMPGSRFEGPFVPFTSSVNVSSDGVGLYGGNIALYARSDNARVNFILPTDAEITTSGVATDEEVEFTVLNQAGTGRFDTGFTPTNTVVIDVEGANNIRRDSETGTLLNFIEAHQNDLVTLRQAERGRPWVATRVTLSNAALLLPSGLFRLQVGVRASLNPALGFIAGLPAGVTPQAGDAYEVSTGNDNFGGYGVQTGDVIVALQDNPNRQISATNDDWLVIRNATNDIISLSEIFFLSTITETDAFEDDRLIDRSDVTAVRVFLSTGILNHAPFITPSADPDNPQDDGVRYVGGDEDVSGGNEFHLTDFTKVGEPAGSTRFPNAFVYFDIDGSFTANTLLPNTFLVMKNAQGEEVARFNADTQFRAVTLTGSTDTYYVLDSVGASDNYSSITYQAGFTIDLVERRTLRSFTLSDAVNALNALADGSIPIEKLQPNVQALITADHSLTDEQESILSGFETTSTPTAWTAGDLYVRDTDASVSSEAGHYFNVGQQNGILGQFDHTRDVTFVVPSFVTVNGLVDADNPARTVDVTRIGALSIQDSTQNPPTTFNGQGFTATLPANTFDINNPVGTSWIVDGTASNRELSGAESSFKIDRDNLSDALATWIQNLIPDTPAPTALPENLQQLSRHLTINTDTTSDWTSVVPQPIRADLARQFAALWDENRRTFTGNYFEDISDVEVIGFQGNNIFYYNSPTDPQNRTFPGAQSYILNDNVRIRNTAGGSEPISEDFTKIISFNYAIDFARIADDANLNMLRVGPSASTAAIGLSGEEGLFLNIGRGDGGQRSRTYNEPLQVDGGHWHDRVDDVESAEAEIIIPQSKTGSVVVQIDIQLDDNGNDEGTHEETVTITNVGADQNLGQRTFDFAGFPSVTCDLTYEHDNNDLSRSRRVIMVRPTQPFTNAALTYNVSAHDQITETWNVSTTYARDPINAGDAHDDFGLFDPHLWETEQLNTRNRVLIAFGAYRQDDTDTDPEMAVVVVVDGELHGTSGPIRLHRPASDFTFDDMSFGNNNVGISHIQVYDYDGPMPSGPEMLRMYNAQDRWLGAFWPAGHAVDDVVIDAHVEVTAGHGIIITDASTGNRTLAELDNGAWTFTTL